jgi:hypothetical protein
MSDKHFLSPSFSIFHLFEDTGKENLASQALFKEIYLYEIKLSSPSQTMD